MPPAKRASSSTAKSSAAPKKNAAAKTKPTAAKSTSAKPAASRRKPAAGDGDGDGGVISAAEQLAKGQISPKDLVMLTRQRLQETLDEAASRGRMTRKDANELVAELISRGRAGGDEALGEIEALLEKGREHLGKGRDQLGSATKRAARSESVERIVRGADRARRAAGVGTSFPISGYPDLNVSQVQSRLKDLSKPDLRKVLNYERKHANRKSVVSAIEKQL